MVSALVTVSLIAAGAKSAVLADVDRDPDPLVAVIGDGLDVSLAHGDALAEALRYLGFGCRRACRLGFAQQVACDGGKRVAGERKAGCGDDHRRTVEKEGTSRIGYD